MNNNQPINELWTVQRRMQRLVSLNFGFAANVFMCGFLTNSVLLRLMEGDHSYIGVRIAMLALCGAATILHIIGGHAFAN
jgi:hypothetical protein